MESIIFGVTCRRLPVQQFSSLLKKASCLFHFTKSKDLSVFDFANISLYLSRLSKNRVFQQPAKSRCIFVILGCCLLAACKHRVIEDEVFYFVVTDRFHNGDMANDTGGFGGDSNIHGYDPTRIRHYHGGDLTGLQKRLPYLKNMGITAIWLTPVFKNIPMQGESASYHGYWITDFTQVDPHLGGNEALKDLVKAAHRANIKIFLDIVINHTADIIRYHECHRPDGSTKPHAQQNNRCPYRSLAQAADNPYTPFIPSGNEHIKSPLWLNNIEYYHNQGDSTFTGESSLHGDFYGLDDVKTEHPDVVTGMIEIYKYWIGEFDIDGFRVDTVKHVNLDFWQQWAPAIKSHAKEVGRDDFFVFGEVYDGDPQNLSQYTTKGKLDSVLDFGLYFAIRDVIANNTGTDRLARLFSRDDLYRDADSSASQLMNFVSNHDAGRLGEFIKRANPDAEENEILARLKLANAILFFARGIPVIYYGDEQGFVSDGDDAQAREDMMPSQVTSYNDNDLIGTDATTADDNFDEDHPLYLDLATKSKLLKAHPGLRRGKQVVHHSSERPGLFVFSRKDKSRQEYWILINTTISEEKFSLPDSIDYYQVIYPEARKKRKANLTPKQEIVVPPLGVKVLRLGNQLADTRIEDIPT